MARHNVRVQRGILATTPQQAKENAIKLREMGARDLIVKSQILAGGRGKGHFDTGFKGGVKVCTTLSPYIMFLFYFLFFCLFFVIFSMDCFVCVFFKF